jgi:transcriptional regulator with XRE-family HTH domain
MIKLTSSRALRDELLAADPEFRAEWERTALARKVAHQVIDYRIRHDLTQAQLARLLGMRQPAIARLEAGEHTPTVEMLERLADKLGLVVVLAIAPAQITLPTISGEIEELLKSNQLSISGGAAVTPATVTMLGVREVAEVS